MLTRPSLDEVREWRAYVDKVLVDALPRLGDTGATLILLGTHHEQQHQELLLTDILSLFAQNPLAPAYWDEPATPPRRSPIRSPGSRDAAASSRLGMAARVRLRLRGAAPQDAALSPCAGRPARHQQRMAGVHRGRRLYAA
jgi:hypothetical protein